MIVNNNFLCIRDKVFKNGASKICGRQPLNRPYSLKFFKGCLEYFDASVKVPRKKLIIYRATEPFLERFAFNLINQIISILLSLHLDLMKLKRQNTTKQVSGGNKRNESTSKKSDALISRYAAGMCFDFHPNDGNM